MWVEEIQNTDNLISQAKKAGSSEYYDGQNISDWISELREINDRILRKTKLPVSRMAK